MKHKARVVTEEQLKTEAEELALALLPTEGARIVALSGDLGAGKTTFVQKLAHALGIVENITSPTFVIEKRYKLSNQRFDTFVHIDAYRLEDASDLEKLNWDETVSNPNNLIIIEWADKIKELLPSDAIYISLEFLDEHTRNISYGN